MLYFLNQFQGGIKNEYYAASAESTQPERWR